MRQRQARPCSIRRAVSALVAIGVGLWCFMHYQVALAQAQAQRAIPKPEPVIAPEPVARHSSGLFAKLSEKTTVTPPTPSVEEEEALLEQEGWQKHLTNNGK